MIRLGMSEAEARELCAKNGYTDYVCSPNGHDACINRLMFTYAILSDLNEYMFGDRWCFSSYDKALAALREWHARDFEGEPEGWHRHPDSGRRRENGDKSTEYIAP